MHSPTLSARRSDSASARHRSRSSAWYRPIACSGCLRSWLIAATKRLFSTTARSATSRSRSCSAAEAISADSARVVRSAILASSAPMNPIRQADSAYSGRPVSSSAVISGSSIDTPLSQMTAA